MSNYDLKGTKGEKPVKKPPVSMPLPILKQRIAALRQTMKSVSRSSSGEKLH